MRVQLFLSSLFCLVVAGAAALSEERPATPIKSADALQAKARYERATAAARKQYLADLDEAIKKATKAGQLDDAVRIRELKASVEGGPKRPARGPKVKVLAAVYGVEGKLVDVRAVAQARLERGLAVSADTGVLQVEDPAPGVVKTLRIEMQIGDTKVSFAVQDGRGEIAVK